MVLYRVKQIYNEVPPYCQQGKTATLYLSRTKANFNRPFFKCANNHDPCSYSQWADQEPNDYTLALNYPSYLPPPPPSPAAELKKKKRFLNPVKQMTSIILTAPKRTHPFKKEPKEPKKKKSKKETTTITTTVLQKGSNIQDPGTPCIPQELQSIEQLLEATFD